MEPLPGYYYAPVIPQPDRLQPVVGEFKLTEAALRVLKGAGGQPPRIIQTWLNRNREVRPHIQGLCPPDREIILRPIPREDVLGGLLKNLPEQGVDILTIEETDYPLSLVGGQAIDLEDMVARSTFDPGRKDRHWAEAFENGKGMAQVIELFMERELGLRYDGDRLVIGRVGFGGKVAPKSRLDML